MAKTNAGDTNVNLINKIQINRGAAPAYQYNAPDGYSDMLRKWLQSIAGAPAPKPCDGINDYLKKILIGYGGVPSNYDSEVNLLTKIWASNGGPSTYTYDNTPNDILASIVGH